MHPETKWFYLRWGGVLVLGVVISLLGLQRYCLEIKTVTPDELLKMGSHRNRVIGRIDAASLSVAPTLTQFRLMGAPGQIPVRYSGGDLENVRALKEIVVHGYWDVNTGLFEASKISLTPNYGFVVAAYLISLVPMLVFLFYMERRVLFLYVLIKKEVAYQAGPDEVLGD